MTEKGKRYKENKRVVRHQSRLSPVAEYTAQMSLHSRKPKKGVTHITKTPVSNGFINTDLAQDNLQNDLPDADI